MSARSSADIVLAVLAFIAFMILVPGGIFCAAEREIKSGTAYCERSTCPEGLRPAYEPKSGLCLCGAVPPGGGR